MVIKWQEHQTKVADSTHHNYIFTKQLRANCLHIKQ